MGERAVIVHRSFDQVQAEMLGEVLRDAGIDARVLGTRSGAQIGVGDVILRLNIEVPAAQEAQAREMLAAFLAGDGADLLRAEGHMPEDTAEPGDDDPAPRETPRRGLIAVGVAMVFPFGAAHFYARRSWTALMLLSAHLVAFSLFVQDASNPRTFLAWVGIHASLVAADAAFAVLAIRAGRRGVTRGLLAQIAMGFALVCGASGGGVLFARVVPEPLFDRQRFPSLDPRHRPIGDPEPIYLPALDLELPAP